MKRFVQISIVTALAAWLPVMSVQAAGPVKFGVKGGLNSAKVTGDDTEGWETRSGFVGGVFARMGVKGPVGLQAELLLASKGGKMTVTEGADTGELTLKADYFEVPVLLRYTLKGQGPTGFNFYAGPVFAFSRSSKTEMSGTFIGFDVSGSVDNFNEKSTDLGLAFGAGLDLNVGRALIVLDVRYTAGLQTMWDDVTVADIPGDLNPWALYAENGEAHDMKNSVISFTAGFMF